MGSYRMLLFFSVLILTAQFSLMSAGSQNPFIDLRQEDHSAHKDTTENVGLNFDSTNLFLEQIKQKEECYQKKVNSSIKNFKRKMPYKPHDMLVTLKAEFKNQKKILETKLGKAKGNIKKQVTAFQEFNRYLIITLNRVDLASTLDMYHAYLQERMLIEDDFIKQVNDNPLSHLFLERPKKDFYHHDIFNDIKKLRDLAQKIRNYLVYRKRENEIFKKEYKWTVKGRVHYMKDRFLGKGKYAKQENTEGHREERN